MKKVIHVISLQRGLGGVQQSFLSYYKYALKHSTFEQYIFSNHGISKKYGDLKNFFSIKKNLFVFIKYLVSKKYIIHFHNKLSSRKVFYLLKFLPSSNIIFHEHGAAWNVKTQQQLNVYKANANLAKKIIINSIATKQVLIKRFKIRKNKLKLAYYGFKDPNIKKKNMYKINTKVGFIGRLESVKGAHSLIEAANLLKDESIVFYIAGDGHLEKDLKKLSKKNNKIKFIGNVLNPLKFIKNLDILVVPSIREPLGIVNIEAGLCKVPVIATNIDGIPEVITNNYSGILINPTKKITLKQQRNQPPLPDIVINPNNYKLTEPRQLDSKILSNSILFLSKNKRLRLRYGLQLYQHVKKRFSMENYFKEIEEIYKKF
jgi:glycosyltransferase involved in cell wall biosynthesis